MSTATTTVTEPDRGPDPERGPEPLPEQHDLACPVCDYSLRGLPEPRCPECGYTFDWAELRERARLRRTWFYEHAETFRSHRQTRWRSLWPRSFWAEIGAYTFANPKRLRRYQWVTLLLLVVSVLPFGLPGALDAIRRSIPQGRFVTATTLPTSGRFNLISQFVVTSNGARYFHPNFAPRAATGPSGVAPPQTMQYHYYLPPPRWADLLDELISQRWVRMNSATGYVAIGFGLALPVLLRLYWMLLRVSVIHAGVKPVHLTRVNAYTTDALPLLMVLGLVAGVLLVPTMFGRLWWMISGSFGLSLMAVMLLPSIVVGVFAWRLSAALRQYVRFPHARPVAWAFGAMAWLAWVVAAINANIA